MTADTGNTGARCLKLWNKFFSAH